VKKAPARSAPETPRLRNDIAVVAVGTVPPGVPADVGAQAVDGRSGRAAAFNRGIAATETRGVLLLDGGTADVDAVARFFREHPRAGLAGAGPEEREASEADGSVLAVRRSLLDRIGPLDEDAGPLLDGPDLSERCRRAGFQVWVLPSLRAGPGVPSGFRERVDRARRWSEWMRKRGRGAGRLRHPVRWLLSRFSGWRPGPRYLKLRDGWTVDESHLEAFADFDRAVEKVRTAREENGRKRIEATVGERAYVVRTTPRGGWMGRLAAALFGARAPREAAVSRRVAASGVPCVPVVAWGDRNYGKAFVTERTSGAPPTAELLRARPRLWRAFGRFIRRLHEAGIEPADYATGVEADAEGRFRLLAWEARRCEGRPFSAGERHRELGRLASSGAASPREVARFLIGYTDLDAGEREGIPGLIAQLQASGRS
jgi:hypothetical protein